MSLGPKSNFIPAVYAGTKKKLKKATKNGKRKNNTGNARNKRLKT